MMDLGLLSREASRNRKAQVNYVQGLSSKGYKWLARTLEQNFSNPKNLERALAEFQKALQLQPKLVPPYVGVAYIWLLLGKRSEAQTYLREALRLDPKHEDAALLMQVAGESNILVDTQALERPEEEILLPENYDALYDELERLIKKQTLYWLQRESPVDPTLDPNHLHRYETERDELSKWLSKTLLHVQFVEEDIETNELRFRLRPLEQLHGRYTLICRISHEFIQTSHAIQGQILQIHHLLKYFHSQPELRQKDVQKDLDGLYDHCDRMADQLDHYERQNLNITDFLPLYENLLGLVEAFSQRVEERD